jgi:hydroxymethylpyrimidine kinase/phosphomethylpyrimidine kinase
MNQRNSVVLTIGGLDPSGGAGLPADARACAAFGAHACGIATAVIAQNTRGVERWEAVSAQMLKAQLENLFRDITPHAVKIGMLPNPQSVEIVAQKLNAFGDIPIIIDTVFAPSNGPQFSGTKTISAIQKYLLPHCDFVTPNISEAAQLLGRELTNWDQIRDAAREIFQHFGPRHVLIKGGHGAEMEGHQMESIDLFFDGHELHELRAPRLGGVEVRGTGCQLAAAIAAQRAQQVPALKAAQAAKTWLALKIESAQQIGQGRRITF